MEKDVIIKEINVKSVMTKTNVPLGGYAVNPYVGCTHACKYCYASFMKRFTGHKEEWGTFIDVKYWPKIINPSKYDDERIVIGTVTDGYNHYEEKFERTRELLSELLGTKAKINICTKSKLVLRDLDLLKKFENMMVSFSINTLDEEFKNYMDDASSIEDRIETLKVLHENGIKTVCFISPIFPGITDIFEIIDKIKNYVDYIWLENLNLRGSFKSKIIDYIDKNYNYLMPLYDEIYNKGNNSYWEDLKDKLNEYVKENKLPYFDNYLPEERQVSGFPGIINFFYHEEVRGSNNTGRRNSRKK